MDRALSAVDARALTDRIKVGMEAIWDLITQAYVERAWESLGYVSWDDYCTREFGTSRLRLPREERSDVVASLRESGLSTRAIAAATGLSQSTVSRELSTATDSNESVAPITGVNGKTYPPRPASLVDETPAGQTATFSCWSCEKSYPLETRTETEDGPLCGDCLDVYDRLDAGESGVAEPARGEEHPASAAPETREQTKPRRQRPLEQGFFDATMRLNKAVTSLENLGKDDRLPRNKEQVARYRNDLLLAIDALQRVADQLN